MSRHLSRMAWKQASTVSRPKRSNSEAMRRAPMMQACTSLSRSAASMSGTRVLRLMMVKTASLRTPCVVELDRRDREAFLEHGDGGARHRARHAAADVVVMAERLDVGDDLAVMKHRHGAAQVGQMADAAFGQIGVVHQEHVARPHRLGRKVAHHRVRHRRIGAAGELAAIAVEQADAVVVRLADHRRARGALDGVFDLGLDRVERALDDLQHDRIDRLARARCGAVGQGCCAWAPADGVIA